MPQNNNLRPAHSSPKLCCPIYLVKGLAHSTQYSTIVWVIEEVRGDVSRKPSPIGPPQCWALLCTYRFTYPVSNLGPLPPVFTA